MCNASSPKAHFCDTDDSWILLILFGHSLSEAGNQFTVRGVELGLDDLALLLATSVWWWWYLYGTGTGANLSASCLRQSTPRPLFAWNVDFGIAQEATSRSDQVQNGWL